MSAAKAIQILARVLAKAGRQIRTEQYWVDAVAGAPRSFLVGGVTYTVIGIIKDGSGNKVGEQVQGPDGTVGTVIDNTLHT